ncbi:HTH-type transcriptional regulator SutR [Paenibacillus solanacearum]|uniref:HTH-type transcriptional regulator SutR n=1 Tax=Paenibacillus solanacearum TaxID=2048548 RepID=A0A916K847_9BACL|nr:XRE family transcriptional regulator [Paenibacillus solanacearum]CAG7651541.1 HTH-type transcriptional regulator SutR [Paenibacillus solanacearum]
MQIGTTIRAIRQRRGITLGQLCEGTGLSQGFMSQVENNKTSPSLATLETIADYFNVPIAYLLLKQEERMSVVRQSERTFSMYRGIQKIEHLAEIGGLRMSITEIPPGIPADRETNAHEGLETHYVIKGKLQVGQGEDMYTVEEGDTFSWHASVPHWVVNAGEEKAVLLIIVYNENYKKQR